MPMRRHAVHVNPDRTGLVVLAVDEFAPDIGLNERSRLLALRADAPRFRSVHTVAPKGLLTLMELGIIFFRLDHRYIHGPAANAVAPSLHDLRENGVT